MSTKILKMIEDIDVNDTNVVEILDEIDKRTWCFIHEKQYLRKMVQNLVDYSTRECEVYPDRNGFKGYMDIVEHKQYTRSRDALKAIRPEGWNMCISTHNKECVTGRVCSLCELSRIEKFINSPNTVETGLPTEELAELHAIIQAIKYERDKT